MILNLLARFQPHTVKDVSSFFVVGSKSIWRETLRYNLLHLFKKSNQGSAECKRALCIMLPMIERLGRRRKYFLERIWWYQYWYWFALINSFSIFYAMALRERSWVLTLNVLKWTSQSCSAISWAVPLHSGTSGVIRASLPPSSQFLCRPRSSHLCHLFWCL